MTNHFILLIHLVLIASSSIISSTIAHYKDYEDLSYSYSEKMAYFPGQREFVLEKDYEGYREDNTLPSSWYSAYSFCTGEHGGSHLDAPYHFSKIGWTLDEIPTARLIDIHAVVVNIEKEVNEACVPGEYVLTVQDLLKHESNFGPIQEGGVVLVHTGWGRYWGNKTAFLGTSKVVEDEVEKEVLSFPGISEEAARWLYNERHIIGIGIDTSSIDPGFTKDYPVHKYFASKQVYGLENLANLHLLVERQLPEWESIPTETRSTPSTPLNNNNNNYRKSKCHYFNLFVLPLKIVGGTGAPARVLAQCKHYSI